MSDDASIHAAAAERIAALNFSIPSPDEIERVERTLARKPIELAAALAGFGIVSPAPVGWRSYLTGIWCWEGSAYHDTVFDEAFRVKWLRIESGIRVPLKNLRHEGTKS